MASPRPGRSGTASSSPGMAKPSACSGCAAKAGPDPTEPPRSTPLQPIRRCRMNPFLRRSSSGCALPQGLKPFPMPSAIDFGPGGRCQRCANCDALPCKIDAKGDAEVRLIRPALRTAQRRAARQNAQVERLITDESGRRIVAAEVVESRVRRPASPPALFVLSAGAINSAALLQRSAKARYPRGWPIRATWSVATTWRTTARG